MPAAAPRIHAVVLAGGAGERFWPASRVRRPKPFLRVLGGRTLLDATLARARRVQPCREGDGGFEVGFHGSTRGEAHSDGGTSP